MERSASPSERPALPGQDLDLLELGHDFLRLVMLASHSILPWACCALLQVDSLQGAQTT
jgi:hypothetical protein